jgi:hypothetical protein
MARARRDLFMKVFSRRSLNEPELGPAVFGAIEAAAPAWKPGRWDVAEPVRRPWEPEQLDEVWSHTSFTCVSAEPGAAVIDVRKRWKHGDTHGDLWIAARSASVEPDAAVTLFQRLAGLLDADYGFLHAFADEDVGQLFGAARYDGQPSADVRAWTLQFHLPGLYWASVFGPSYVEMLGEDTIRSTPAATVSELGPRSWYVQLTSSLLDNQARRDEVVAARGTAMRHLGVGAFWRPGMSRPIMPRTGRPRPPGRAPSFDDLRLETSPAAGR